MSTGPKKLLNNMLRKDITNPPYNIVFARESIIPPANTEPI